MANLVLVSCQVICTSIVETCYYGTMHYFLTYGRYINFLPCTMYITQGQCFFFLSDYLLSNNSVNSIIIHKFDFSDEEVRCLVL